MWEEPKTNWKETDYFNYPDYNRIKNNIEYLRELAVQAYPDFELSEMGDDKTNYSEFPYADEFNLIEKNITTLLNNTYAFSKFNEETWYENAPTPTYNDLNRIEGACINLYYGLTNQINMKQRLSVKLGMQRGMVRS